jgi:glycosyltransferase involved in cell wall biosynthesis
VSGKKGRILTLTSNFPRWNGDSTTPFVRHLAEDLAALGWAVDVLAPHAPGAVLSEELGLIHVERFRYWWPASRQNLCYNGGALVNLRSRQSARLQIPALIGMELLAAVQLARRSRYDLIHSHWILPQGLVGGMVGRLFRRPNVVTVHGGDVFGLRGKWLEKAKAVALRQAERITVNSSATRSAVEQLVGPLPTIHEIAMGATEHRARDCASIDRIRAQLGKGSPLIAFVGRLVPEKGIGDLIEAFEILARKGNDSRLMIIGDGPMRAQIEDRVARIDCAGRIHFLGWLGSEAVADHLAAADMFVGPSRQAPDGWREAQGLTFAEAMLAGIAVIATRSGGVPDTVRDGETGLLVDENSPQQIAAAIERLLGDRALARRLAEQGKMFATKHRTRRASAQNFDRLFTEMLQGNRQLDRSVSKN